jgi:nucleoside-diphosphate-sugar epimerase
MRTVIIIGSTGFLGSAVLKNLLDRPYHVFVVEHKQPIKPIENITVIKGGISGLTSSKLKEINPEFIFHCARPTLPFFKKWGRILAAEKARFLNNQLLKNLDKSGLNTHLIFAAGSLSYGNSSLPHSEKSLLNPLSFAKQYIRGETPFLKDFSETKFSVLVLRFPWLLGTGSWFSWFYLKNINEKNKIPLFGKGENKMSIIDSMDAANLMVRYAEKKLASGVYNIYSPHLPYQLEFAQMVAQQFNCEITDFKHLYPNGLEQSALEAFHSNIILTSDYIEILQAYPFKSITETLKKLG